MSNKEILPGHCWRDGGEQIEVTPFVVIASSDRAEEFGLSEAIGLDQASDVPFLASYRVNGLHTFLHEPLPLWLNVQTDSPWQALVDNRCC